IEDEYYLGDNIIYAPQIYENTTERTVYLPEGRWYDFEKEIMLDGSCYFRTENNYPIYVKDNSCFLFRGEAVVIGSGKFTLFFNDREYEITAESGSVKVSPEGLKAKIIKGRKNTDHE
ncbi:MAG: glycoside hydrolase family 31 protein, partial [Cuniculiplasma sp.]|nr:glycoside hydrolase family 31 protein [Cuniculiplasma sp.]